MQPCQEGVFAIEDLHVDWEKIDADEGNESENEVFSVRPSNAAQHEETENMESEDRKDLSTIIWAHIHRSRSILV